MNSVPQQEVMQPDAAFSFQCRLLAFIQQERQILGDRHAVAIAGAMIVNGASFLVGHCGDRDAVTDYLLAVIEAIESDAPLPQWGTA